MRKILFFIIMTGILVSCSKPEVNDKDRIGAESAEQPGLYRTIDRIYAEIKSLKLQHPDKLQVIEIGRGAVLKKPVDLLRLSGNYEKPAVQFLFVAGTHGDEAVTVKALLHSVKKLLSGDEFDIIVQKKLRIDFIPLHNPDGYAGNKRENGNNMNLNRDFPYGKLTQNRQPETQALIGLINGHVYNLSLFFHSSNEQKYENLIRVPLELGRLGPDVLAEELAADIGRLAGIIENAGNAGSSSVPWRRASDLVDAAGIASDWCVSGKLKNEFQIALQEPCVSSHPSLTIEICYPKQPMNLSKLNSEKEEMFRIIREVIRKY